MFRMPEPHSHLAYATSSVLLAATITIATINNYFAFLLR